MTEILTKENVAQFFNEKTQAILDETRLKEKNKIHDYIMDFLNNENNAERVAMHKASDTGQWGFYLTLIPKIEDYKLYALREMGFYTMKSRLDIRGNITEWRVGWYKRPEPPTPPEPVKMSDPIPPITKPTEPVDPPNDIVGKTEFRTLKTEKKPWWHIFG